MKNILKNLVVISFSALLLAGCMSQTPLKTTKKEPDKLYIYNDGTMEFRDRPIAADDVVIYEDGRGGEKAAVQINLEPLHPPFYRDSIVVIRKPSKS